MMDDPKLEVLNPRDSQAIFIEHRPQVAFGVQSIDRQVLKNNTVALAKAAKALKIPTIITSVENERFSGYPESLDKVVVSGLWPELSDNASSLSAMLDGSSFDAMRGARGYLARTGR